MRTIQLLHLLLCSVLLLVSSRALADRFADVQIEATELAPGLYMLTGAGGNMAALTGDDGILLIDAQFAEMAGKIEAKLSELAEGQTLQVLVNTHFHGDHVGGNAKLAADSRIIAHDNVRKRLQADSNFPAEGLPNLTFTDQLSLHMNGQHILLTAMQPSHTDGDSIVWFKAANVVHMGDLMFEGRFPFIDTNAGGNLQAYMDVTRHVFASIDANTRVIPGHGELTNRAGLERELRMMEATLAQVQQFKAEDLTLEAMIARGLGEQWQDWHWNFITEERWIRTLYQALAD
ncbi:MBL fold metallo-hydrolase [Alkalimonas sp. MEB108]|uniref:MBL fold metallo-hydrolase n=1 Tax=Alkalimonas cellulosilytica TaxID=3058395 RepID=A0ABU7J7Y9_9GAMM|nr:MBL fold metallo-hydrolase [Alkalimonas sp. MEB108]MEE2002639.1 MBL fold metallo-hydrolase [Alkalimonas sp. MEB108]